MRTIMAAVVSQDGFIKNANPEDDGWQSIEDFQRFSKIRNRHNTFVMGRKTYEANAGNMADRPGLLRLILTKDPLKHSGELRPEYLEFTNESPQELVKRLRSENRQSLLVLGGSVVYGAFLNAKLVDEIELTIEPVMLKSGIPFLPDGKLITDYTEGIEPTAEILNEAGTTLYNYVLNK